MTPLDPTRLRTAALGITAVAAPVLWADLGGPVRVVALLAALLLAPGLAVVSVLRLDSAVAQVAVAVGSSMAALILVSEVLLYLGVASAGWAFAALATGTIATCFAPQGRARPGARP